MVNRRDGEVALVVALRKRGIVAVCAWHKLSSPWQFNSTNFGETRSL